MKSFLSSVTISSLLLGSAISLFAPLMSSSEDSAKAEATAPAGEVAQVSTEAPSGETPAGGSSVSKEAAQTEETPVATKTVSSCLSDPIVLDEIKKKHEEIDKKWKDLEAHEAELKARESAVNEELKKLQTFRDEIAKTETDHLQANQEKVAKVVETLEGMNPKAASQMISSLDEHLAVMAISLMSTPKLSKVMNVMEPARATKLTELLAGVVRAKQSGKPVLTASNDVAETSIVPEKKSGAQKGETNNDQQSEQIISGGPDTVAKRSPSSKKP